MTRLRAGLLTAAVLAAGCRNPFVASSDIEFAGFTNTARTVQRETTAANRDANFYSNLGTQAQFIAKSRVGAVITSINLTYTDLAGNPVTTYRTTGGKTFKIFERIPPKYDRASLGFGKGSISQIPVPLVDGAVYDELDAQVAVNRAVIAHVTMRGEDDQGYDLVFEGSITIWGVNWP